MNIFHSNITSAAAAAFIAVLAATGASTATAAPLPSELTFTNHRLIDHETGHDLGRTSIISAGASVHIGFTLKNTSDTPVTVNGYESGFAFDNEVRQCYDYFTIFTDSILQPYPQVVKPDEEIDLFDNMIFRLEMNDDESCQQLVLYLIGDVIFAGSYGAGGDDGGDDGDAADDDADGDNDDDNDDADDGDNDGGDNGGLPPSSPSSSSSLVGSLGSLLPR